MCKENLRREVRHKRCVKGNQWSQVGHTGVKGNQRREVAAASGCNTTERAFFWERLPFPPLEELAKYSEQKSDLVTVFLTDGAPLASTTIVLQFLDYNSGQKFNQERADYLVNSHTHSFYTRNVLQFLDYDSDQKFN